MSSKESPTPPDRRAIVSASPVTVLMRAYFSTYHLWAAKHFSDRTAEIETRPGDIPRFDIEHRAFATSAVLSAVAFLEAAINELFQDAADGHTSYLEPLDSETVSALAGAWDQGIDRLSLLGKYQLACHLTRTEPFDPGDDPFQSAALLVRLRNALVHYRPKNQSAKHMTSLEKGLEARFPQNALMAGAKGNPFFPDKCLGTGCTSWAVSAVEKFGSEFFGRLGIKPNFKRVSFASSAGEGA